MPFVVSQQYTEAVSGDTASFSKIVQWNHREDLDITVVAGTPYALPMAAFAAGPFTLSVISTPSSQSPYTPMPFTITLGAGLVMQFDDLAVLNLSALPASVTIGVPAGAAATNLKVIAASQA